MHRLRREKKKAKHIHELLARLHCDDKTLLCTIMSLWIHFPFNKVYILDCLFVRFNSFHFGCVLDTHFIHRLCVCMDGCLLNLITHFLRLNALLFSFKWNDRVCIRELSSSAFVLSLYSLFLLSFCAVEQDRSEHVGSSFINKFAYSSKVAHKRHKAGS